MLLHWTLSHRQRPKPSQPREGEVPVVLAAAAEARVEIEAQPPGWIRTIPRWRIWMGHRRKPAKVVHERFVEWMASALPERQRRMPDALKLLWHSPPDDRVLSIAFSQDGTQALTGDRAGRVQLWRLSK